MKTNHFCCEDMEIHVYHTEKDAVFDGGDKEDKVVYYSSTFNEYGLPIHDGENGMATSYVTINFCPWCGKKLPVSKSDEWFETLEKMGYENPFVDENIPEEFKTSEW